MSEATGDFGTQSEQTFATTAFGTVTSKRVIYHRAKGWFSGGSREDIPLKHVTAVRLETSRSVLAGILLLLVGLTLLAAVSIGTKLCGAGLIFWAALLFWGSPAVVVNTSGNDLRPAKGTPWQREEATTFVEALRGQLFKE